MTERYKERMLLEWIAAKLKLDSVAERLPGKIPLAYLFVGLAIVFQLLFIDGYNYAVDNGNISIFYYNPGRVFYYSGTILGVVGVYWMRTMYAEAIEHLQIRDRENSEAKEIEERFTCIVPFRAKQLLWVLAMGPHFINVFFVVGVSRFIEIDGVVKFALSKFLVTPLVQIPLIVEFTVMYFGIHFLLPRRLVKADLDLFFYDPQNMGGFGLVGDLFKRSYYLYTAGLLVYFGLVYWPYVLPRIFDIQEQYPDPPLIVAASFTALWLVGVVSIANSMYRTHSLMSKKKNRAIREISSEIKNEYLDHPYDITRDHIEDPEKREEIQHKIAKIQETRRYPSTFTMWSQILVSVLIPQALQLALQALP